MLKYYSICYLLIPLMFLLGQTIYKRIKQIHNQPLNRVLRDIYKYPEEWVYRNEACEWKSKFNNIRIQCYHSRQPPDLDFLTSIHIKNIARIYFSKRDRKRFMKAFIYWMSHVSFVREISFDNDGESPRVRAVPEDVFPEGTEDVVTYNSANEAQQ